MKREAWRPTVAGLLVAAGVLVGAGPVAGQALSVERIFGSAEFRPRFVFDFEWVPDGRRYSFLEAGRGGVADLWAADVATGARSRVVEGASLVPAGEARPIEIEGYAWSPDGSKLLIYTRSVRVWRQNTKGYYYLYDLASGRLAPLSTAPGYQQFAKFSPDGRRVGFVRNNDLYVVDLATGEERRLTHDGSEVIINGTFDWVYEEELDLRDGWRWSPDGRRIAFWRLDQSGVKPFPLVNELGVYPEIVPVRYPKAGEANARVQVGVIELETGKTVWVDVGSDPDIYIARMDWAASPDELVLQRLNRRQDRLEVLLADAVTGRSRVVLVETDSAWVDVDDDLRWVAGGRQFLWSSERDGYNHLYLYGRDGRLVRQLTRGAWDVLRVEGVDEAGGWVYFTAWGEGPRERHFYRVRLSGGRVERLSREPGVHAVDFSAEHRAYLDTWSRSGQPPAMRLFRADGTRIRTLEDNAELAERLRQAGVRPAEFFTFRTSDGVELHGWMIKPPDFDPTRRYPVLMAVYGGPGSQTVMDGWGGNQFLWYQMLAQKGYIVVSVDNRGTGGRGRAFKKVTYLNLGKWESHDQIEAARHLASLPYVDPGRIGIWGWSYGGYMTALTMMKGGELFRAGIAVAPVTDWRLYDTIYTERYMRTPRENPEGYRESAPVRHVAGLRGDLLLVHGTGDDNVHFQNTVQLVNALQAAGKQFGLMIYPNRTHSIAGGNTQVHLFTLLTNWLDERLAGAGSKAR